MTVSSQTNKVIYIGNGIATEFAIPFSFLEKEHLKVREKKNDIQTERTDWEIRDGNLVFQTAPESGSEIAIVREVPLTQETDYRDNEILHAETLERNFDKLTMQVQQLAEKSERAVAVDIFDDTQADSLIPSIRKAVSDCAESVETVQTLKTETGALLTAAKQQVQTATEQAQTAATSAKNAAASETNTATMLGTKANTALDNLTAAGKNLIAELGMPKAAYSTITIGASGVQYTAPKNGWFSVSGRAASEAGYVQMYVDNSIWNMTTEPAGWYAKLFIPVKKGRKMTLKYVNFTLDYLRFTALEGEN